MEIIDSSTARVPVRLMQGTLAGSHLSEQGDSLGRGIGSLWAAAIVKVVVSATKDKQVVTMMDVPKNLRHLPDEELVRRFVEGFGAK